MKRITILSVLAGLSLSLCVLLGGLQPPKPPVPKPIVVYVIAADAPKHMRFRGLGRYLCNGTDDDVPTQAAVDFASSFSEPGLVELSLGSYSWTSPVYIGYSAGGLVEGNEGCSLVGQGKVEITWVGDTVTDCSQFMLQVAPSLFNVAMEIKNLQFLCKDKINGVFTHNLVRGNVENILIQRSRYIGLLVNSSWTSHYEQIDINNAEGMGAIFLRCNAGVISRINHHGSTPSRIPEVWSYNWSASSGGAGSTFQPLEVLTEEDGGEEAIFLGWMGQPNDVNSSRILVAYTDTSTPDRFDHGKEIEGGTSGDTATIRINAANEEYDCMAGIFITAQQFLLQNVGLENLDHDDDPLLLVIANTGRISNVYFEQTTSHPSSAAPDNPAEILIKLNECRNVVVENVYGHAGTTVSAPANAYNCLMTDDGATGTVSSMVPTTFGSRLQAGDDVYIWDGVGGIVDRVYTVGTVAGDDLSFTVDEDPGTTSGVDDCWVYAIDHVIRTSPATIVNMEECRGCVVREMNYRGCRTSFVVINSECTDCVVDTVRDFYVEEATQDDDFWLAIPHPTFPVDDSGTGSQSYNLQVYDPYELGLITGDPITYTGIDDDVQILDEVDGNTYRTTLVLHNKQMSIDGAAIGFGTEKIYDFPTGNILVLGVVVDVVIDATDQYDSGTTISDTADGDVSCGTTGTDNSTLDSTDVDLAAKTDIAQLTGGTGPVDAPLVPLTPVSFNGTGGAKDAFISVLIDDADISGSTTIALRGTVTIHWVELGDY